MDTCESGHGVTIDRLDANETADPPADRVAYSNLSATEQQVFEEILNAETTPVYQNATRLDGLTQKVVTYRGDRYETSPLFVSDCFTPGAFYQFVGGLGALLVVIPCGWRRIG